MNKAHYCYLSTDKLNTKYIPNDSLCGKMSRFIRESTTISENYPLRKYYFRSLKSYHEEKINHIRGKYWFSIHPFSNFQYFRNIVMAVIYMSGMLADQIDIAFLSKCHSFVHPADTILVIINTIAFVDLLLHFVTGYVLQEEKMNIHYYTGYYKTAETATVLNQRKIAVRYLRTYFIADIFCLSNIVHLTTDLISKDFGFYYIYASLRHIRIIRMVTVEQTSHLLLNNVRFKQDLLLIIQCIVLYVFFSIFFGTMLIYIPDIIAHLYGEDRSAYLSRLKLYYNRFDKKLTSSVIFMHTTYDAFCLLTVFQTKESEKTVEVYIIVIAAMIVGNILKILVFLTVYSIINRRFQSTINHIIFMKEVKNYAESLDLSKQLSLDIYNYLNVKLKQEYFRESEIQKTLQRKMQYEIFAECSMGLMRNCHLFRNLPNYFLVQLSLRLKCETYVPGVTVISVGEIATCMYFIATGTVAVYSADGRELCHLSDGEYVGEIGILQSTARVADIVTIEHCELYRLDIKDFQEVIKPNSKFYKRIYKIAMMRMNAHVNLESDNKR